MSDLLNSASLVLIPSGYKEDIVYSAVPTDGSGDLSFTRASNGTRVNSAGLVEVCPWNLVEQSETFDNAYWQKANVTVSANATTAPNGTATADKIISSAVNDEHVIYYFESTYVNQVVTLSAYVKKADYRYAIIRSFTNGTYRISVFDLNNGVVEGQDLGASIIESVGNGWYRVSTTFTAPAGTYGVQYGFSATPTYSYLGDGTSGNFLWGAQLNIGSTAKPYFPTTDRLNVPRLTYQNGGGGCPSLLLEKQSTNLALYSEQFDNAYWDKGNISITANATTSPDGTTNADKLAENTALDSHYFGDLTTSATSGQSVTFTIFAKASERSWVAMRLYNGNASIFGYYNLANGTLGTISSGGIASITAMGNGWYRCALNITMASSSVCLPFVFASTGDGTFIYTGTSGSGLFVWGAQVENSSYPTSYIPTTSASATRVADACFKTGISSLIGQTSGTIFWDIQVDIANAATLENILNLDAGSFSDTIYFAFQGSLSKIVAEMYVTGVAQASFNLTSITAGRYKMAIGYANNNTAFFVNGVQVGTTDTSCSVPAMSRLQLGSGVLGPSDGKVNQAVLFTTRLTNAELASLTTL